MTLDEAIKYAEEIAEENQRVVDTGIVFDDVTIDMLYCDDTEVIEEHLANYKRRAEDHRQLAKWLKELKQKRWIPVSERLPEKNVWVLATFKMANGKTSVDIKRINQWNGQWESNYDFDVSYYDNVIAWMPLPAPYKKESEEEK